MKVLLLLAKGFETMEASVFIDVMGWARVDHQCDVEVVTCGFNMTVVSTFGVPVTVDVLIDEVSVDDYDALAVPGGFAEFGFYEEVYTDKCAMLIRSFVSANKPVASVCVGALALAYSGILKGKRATTYHLNGGMRQKQLAEFGVDVINEPIVNTDNIITSYCPQTAPGVAFALLEILVGTEKMTEVRTAMGY